MYLRLDLLNDLFMNYCAKHMNKKTPMFEEIKMKKKKN